MAAITSAVIGGLGVAKGVYDTISANKRQKEHQAELDAYQRQELVNVYKDMPISTIGTDMMREDAARNMATSMNTIGNAGTRAIIGATPKLLAEQNNVNRSIQQSLEEQDIKRNYVIAQDESNIRAMQEQREVNDLAGLGNAIDVARQDKNMGLNTILNSAMAGASAFDSAKTNKKIREGVNKGFTAPTTSFPSTIGFKSSMMPSSPTVSTSNDGLFDPTYNSDLIDKYGKKSNYKF